MAPAGQPRDERRPPVPVRDHPLGGSRNGGGSKHHRAAGSRGDRALPPPRPRARPGLRPRPVHPRTRAQRMAGRAHRQRAGRDRGGGSRHPGRGRAQPRRRRRHAAGLSPARDVRLLPRHRLLPRPGRRAAPVRGGRCLGAGQVRSHLAAELRPEPAEVAGRTRIADGGPGRRPAMQWFAHSRRIQGVVVAHIYPCVGILAHDLPALREPRRGVSSIVLVGNQIDAPMFCQGLFGREIRRSLVSAGGRTRQGWAAPDGGQALIRSRGQQSCGKRPGAAGGSFEGQHRWRQPIRGPGRPGS
jgi:hypothetical protein